MRRRGIELVGLAINTEANGHRVGQGLAIDIIDQLNNSLLCRFFKLERAMPGQRAGVSVT